MSNKQSVSAIINNAETVIDVENIKKKFRSYQDKATSFKERFVNPSRRKHEDIWVLKGISFQVKRGEAVGIIGKNGCGKSTTLKLLTKILYPSDGHITMKGRVSSLIELGAGFHPDMTGRENIYTNASIFGITRKEVEKRLNDIIRFSELEDYIDSPVRTYSSGMYMRLAFAVAINVDADILLIDEILAVGDSAFQKKCFEKLKEIKANGTTIVIVSHSMDQMYKICDRLIWLENGLIKAEGFPRIIGEEYLAEMEGRRLDRIELEKELEKKELEKKLAIERERQLAAEKEKIKREEEKRQLAELEKKQIEMKKNETLKSICSFCHPSARRNGEGKIHYTNVKLLDSSNKETNSIYTGELCHFVFNYSASVSGIQTKFVIGITREDGSYCYGTSVNMNDCKPSSLLQDGEVTFSFENRLLKGNYFLDLWIETADGFQHDAIYSLMMFHVETTPYNERGFFSMQHSWNVDGKVYDI